MSERDIRQQRVKQLIAQDPEINEKQMKEFRMQLEQTLELYEAKAKQTRRRILIAWVVYMAAMLANVAMPTHWRDATVDTQITRLREWVFIPLGISTVAAMVFGMLLILLYLFKYWPQLNRARFDVQTSMMLELQQQVKELRESVARREK
jgi:cation transport ATPase